MNQWDFTFEPAAWEGVLEAMPRMSTLSAAKFLTLMESETEEDFEDALELLDRKDILLTVADLPFAGGSSEMAARLHLEQKLSQKGNFLQDLEETDPLRLYLEELAMVPACGDIRLLAERLQGVNAAGGEDPQLCSQILNLCLSRIVELAREHAGCGVLLLDLIQEGSLALWQSLSQYAEGNFSEFCDRKVRQAMAKSVTLQARANGVGQKMRQAIEDYRSVDERLLTELGRNPTLEEIADAMHISPETAACVAENLESARMLSRAKKEPEPEPEEEQQAVEDTAYFQMRQRISELLSGLSAEDAQLLTLRFGLEGGLPMNPEQVGTRMGLTASEVVARETAALAKLREQR